MRYFLIILIFFIAIQLNADAKYADQIKELKEKLREKQIPEAWINKNFSDNKFKIYDNIDKYFKRMPETRVAKKEKNFEWYKKYFAVEKRTETGKTFLKKYKNAFDKIEKRFGVDRELITAVMAIESNYADEKQRGNFYTFNTLVSQYVLVPRRKNFALNEIIALYKFAKKTDEDTFHFIGSFAGACGWAQFIPSSLLHYFTDIDNIDKNTDIFSVKDCLAGVASYLNAHGLKKNTMENRDKIEDAVYAYNHSKHYVKAVMIIYDGLKNKGD